MIRIKSSRLTITVALVATAMLVAGGASIASNMGFKLNKAYVQRLSPSDPNLLHGINVISLPYNNPYATAADLCAQLGLVGNPANATYPGPRGTNFATVQTLNHVTGAFRSQGACGFPSATSLTLLKGESVHIRQANQNQPGGAVPPASLLIVGSHDPTFRITSPRRDTATPPNLLIGELYFPVPYHTTAITYRDVCLQAGFGPGRATIQRLDAETGFTSQHTCGGRCSVVPPLIGCYFNSECPAPQTCLLNPNGTLSLVLGEAALIRPLDPVSFIPAHF